MKNRSKLLSIAGLILIALIAVAAILAKKAQAPAGQDQRYLSGSSQPAQAGSADSSQQGILDQADLLAPPLARYKERMTKKPFGIYVTPQNSPVSPERFTGFHTGLDFETFPEEQNQDVPISAVCAGKLLSKKQATGYGGVAVQACKLNGQDVTVIYGHLRLSSITAKAGQQLKAGDFLAMLGKGYSKETDGERKHLHLSIHKGTKINLLGYVQNQKDLDNWLDPQKLLP